ncbi:MAG: right-handed parallel beta-helix repeat-containing protein [Anaerolineae bacterium]|nr:right-handed parallel beta-helix repeat-containing protein [Anaerolineae bacterium]
MNDKAITPTDGMVVLEDTILAPGVYTLPNGITIGADGVTLDGAGTQIVGRDHTGAGLRAANVKGVTIQGISIAGYHHGVRMDRCEGVTVERITVRDTTEIPGIDTFLNLWQRLAEAYGGGILLNEVTGGVIRDDDLQHQQNGVMLYNCTGLTVERNNASFNSGWGVYLARSNENIIQDNQLDFCNRTYRRKDGTIRVEADAAAITLVHGSSRNKLLRNSCLCGGDGIFIAGYCHPGDVNPCSDNLVEANDCRLSPNNAIESTFSRGNVFRRNDCSRSNYGFWLGYSWDNLVEDNHVEFNRWVGIAAEHAHNMTFRSNTIRRNGEGIRLWTRGGEILKYYPGFEVAFDCRIEDNLIESNEIGFNAYTGDDAPDRDGYSYHLAGNTFRDNRDGVRMRRVRQSTIAGNTFEGNVVSAICLQDRPDVTVGENRFAGNAADLIEE